MCGILLKRQGHNVRILEQATSSQREGTAAGIGLSGHMKVFMSQHDRLRERPIATSNAQMHVLDSKLDVAKKIPLNMDMTSWDAVYYRLRANFDALQSSYCLDPPAAESSEGEGVFETGKLVVGVDDVDGTMTVTAEDAKAGASEKINADLVIAADGANSRIRRQMQPSLERDEPGYVIWRGTVPMRDLSSQLLAKIGDRTCFLFLKYSYVVMSVESEYAFCGVCKLTRAQIYDPR